MVLGSGHGGFGIISEGNSRIYFEFDEDGFGERTGWARGDDGVVARDANGNGTIDDVTELSDNRTQSGFAALGVFDLNADGAIDTQDAVYSELRVWRDADQDGVTDAGEMKTLTELGIVSIDRPGYIQASIQGLELDWGCLCWDANLRRAGDAWQTLQFKGAAWQAVNDPARQLIWPTPIACSSHAPVRVSLYISRWEA